MIGSLRGKVLEVHGTSILLEVAGVGYIVRAAAPVLAAIKAGEERFLYTHDHVREDVHDLFGFISREELAMFDSLLSISGVGPKAALTILSVGSIQTVTRAIMTGDISLLTSVPGVGKKTAQKIILELKGQIVDDQEMPLGDVEVVEALVSLGYSAQQSREVLKGISPDIVDVAARVREALKRLGK